MRVLITGATGFLGSHLCRRFVHEGHDVTALHRPTSTLSAIEDLSLNEAVADITDAEAVASAVAGHEVVIHAAAHGAYWRRYAGLQKRVNVGGTRNVLDACAQHGVRRLIHVSSMVAIGVPSVPTRPAGEDFPFNLPVDRLSYPATKRQAEAEVLRAVEGGLDAVIVNPTSIFGPFEAHYRGGEMIEKVRHGKVVTYFTGGRNVVHVDDVVVGIVAALQRGQRGERYILGGDNVSYRQIAQIAAEELGIEKPFLPVPPLLTGLLAAALEPLGNVRGQRPWITFDVHYFSSRFQYYDSSKAERELQYEARPFRSIVWEHLVRRDAARQTTQVPT